jgi:hypothetical protein
MSALMTFWTLLMILYTISCSFKCKLLDFIWKQKFLICLDSKGFWRWYIPLRITGFLDFIHRQVFLNLENTRFRKLDLFPSSGEWRKTPTHQLGPLERDNLNHWTKYAIIITDMSKGDNKNACNKNCVKACTDLKQWSDPTCQNLPWFFFSLQEYTQQNPLSKF